MSKLLEEYGVELQVAEKIKIATSILMEEYDRIEHFLETASDTPQMIDALKRKEAISYGISLLADKFRKEMEMFILLMGERE